MKTMNPFSSAHRVTNKFVNQRFDVQSDEASVLADIYDPLKNIAIWTRDLDASLLASIETLFVETSSLKIEGDVTPESAYTFLMRRLEKFQCATALSAEIAALVDMFCCLFDLDRTGLRLATLEHAMCPRFHTDKVPCRLVTTFRGTATQWLPHHTVDRSKLGHGNRGLPDHESGIYQNAAEICQMTEGDVALLKGESWEGNEHAGLVHRSPELHANEKRLLLSLDFIG
jgi:hypothetical protein